MCDWVVGRFGKGQSANLWQSLSGSSFFSVYWKRVLRGISSEIGTISIVRISRKELKGHDIHVSHSAEFSTYTSTCSLWRELIGT